MNEKQKKIEQQRAKNQAEMPAAFEIVTMFKHAFGKVKVLGAHEFSNDKKVGDIP